MNIFPSLLVVLADVPEQLVGQSQGIGWFLTALVFLGMLVILVFVHELGHFAVAMLMKIPVEEFGIGYPPRMLTLITHKGVRYTLNWLPLGGFVKFVGEDSSVYGAGSLSEARPWRKIPVMVAGPLMNLILAVIIFAILFMAVGIPNPISQHITSIYANTPAAQAGFQEGDVLIQLADQEKVSSQVINQVGSTNQGKPVDAVVLRDGEEIVLQVVPGAWTAPTGQHFDSGFGFSYIPEEIEIISVNFFEAIGQSLAQTTTILVRMIEGLITLVGSLFQLAEAPEGGVAGPIGIARATGEVIDRGGAVAFWNWMALISINLFVLNLLPIPALDGSHILFSLIEWIRGGKKVPPEKEAIVHAVGFMTLMGLIILVSVSDVINAIKGVPVLGG
jgi:regulator of sigma E protease